MREVKYSRSLCAARSPHQFGVAPVKIAFVALAQLEVREYGASSGFLVPVGVDLPGGDLAVLFLFLGTFGSCGGAGRLD
jgi:hypothetical protein